jgi:hypothetical protein
MANATTGNYNFGAAYIMNADKTSVDKDEGASSLYRESLEFDTRVQTGPMIEAMPKEANQANCRGFTV